MNTTLKFIKISSILFLFAFTRIFSQTDIDFGIDVSKTLINNIGENNSGIIIEPLLLLKPSGKNLCVKAVLGYSKIRKEERGKYGDIDFSSKGFYLKNGIGYAKQSVAFYGNIVASYYNTRSDHVIEGQYFGDYTVNYSKNNIFKLGLEPNLDFSINISSRLSFLITTRIDFIVLGSANNKFPDFYSPGFGRIDYGPFTNLFDKKRMTAGASLYLLIR